MLNAFKAFLSDESGATAVEYGLLLGLIALALIAGATIVGQQIDRIFILVGDPVEGTTVNTGT